MTFEYCQRIMVEAEIDIPDIGECAILARTDLGEEFYLLIRSELGYCHVIEYGPSIPDLSVLPASVTYTYDYFEYSQYKLEKRIEKFLNNSKRGITQAQVVEVGDILPHFRNLATVIFQVEEQEPDEDINEDGDIPDEE